MPSFWPVSHASDHIFENKNNPAVFKSRVLIRVLIMDCRTVPTIGTSLYFGGSGFWSEIRRPGLESCPVCCRVLVFEEIPMRKQHLRLTQLFTNKSFDACENFNLLASKYFHESSPALKVFFERMISIFIVLHALVVCKELNNPFARYIRPDPFLECP